MTLLTVVTQEYSISTDITTSSCVQVSYMSMRVILLAVEFPYCETNKVSNSFDG